VNDTNFILCTSWVFRFSGAENLDLSRCTLCALYSSVASPSRILSRVVSWEICVSSQKTNTRHGCNLRASEQRRRGSEWKLVEEDNNEQRTKHVNIMTYSPFIQPQIYSCYQYKRHINRDKENLTILKSSAKTENTGKMDPPVVKPTTKVAGIKDHLLTHSCSL
jgi:hypothetical protein